MSERRDDAGRPAGGVFRYPGAALVVAVVAVAVGVNNVAAGDYGDGEGVAMAIDFALAVVVTFVFWYAVVLAVGWVVRRVRRS